MQTTSSKQIEKLVSWISSTHPWAKLNTYGSFKAHLNSAAAGGIILSHTGEWIRGFTTNLGSCSILAAEVWGCYIWVEACLGHGYSHVNLRGRQQIYSGYSLRLESM